MTEAELLNEIKVRAKSQAAELFDEILTEQAEGFEVNTDLNAEPIDAQAVRLLKSMIDQLEALKGMLS